MRFNVSTKADVAKQTLSTSAAKVGSTHYNRARMIVKNTDATITVYIGNSSVTNAGVGGMEIKAGESAPWECAADCYAVGASGAPVICYMDFYSGT